MAVTCQRVVVTYCCVDGLCLVVAAVANNGTSGSTMQDVIEAAVATMVSSLLYSGPIAGGVLGPSRGVMMLPTCSATAVFDKLA
jgi:hypothetical protein